MKLAQEIKIKGNNIYKKSYLKCIAAWILTLELKINLWKDQFIQNFNIKI